MTEWLDRLHYDDGSWALPLRTAGARLDVTAMISATWRLILRDRRHI